MLPNLPRFFRAIGLAVFFLSACFVQGEQGLIKFDDINKYPTEKSMNATWADRTFNPNVGVGASISFEPASTLGGSITVGTNGTAHDGNTLYHARVTHPEIFEVIQNDGPTITVRAKIAGSTVLSIESSDGLFDYIELNAVDVFELRMLVRSDRTVFTGWGFGEPFTDKGLAVMPGASFEAGIEMIDKDGNWLSGELPIHWDSSNTLMVESGYANAKGFISGEGNPELSAIALVDGEELFLPLGLPEVTKEEVLHLGIFHYIDLFGSNHLVDVLDGSETLVVEEGTVFRTVYLMDKEDRLVIPPEPGAISVQVLDGPDCLAQEKSDALTELDELNLTQFESCVGTGIIRLSYMGVVREVALKVTPRDH
jgi:hypothetical protein